MVNANEFQANEERLKDLARSAERERLVRSLPRQRAGVREVLGRGLVALGEQLLNERGR